MKKEPTVHMSRAELEQRLKEKGEAISSRFESMESKIPKKMPSLLSVVKSGAKTRVGIAIGAGLLMGILLFRKKSEDDRDYDDGIHRISDRLASRITELLRDGKDYDEAVKQALEEQPPLLRLNPDKENVLMTVLKQVLLAGVSVLGTELAEYLRNRASKSSS